MKKITLSIFTAIGLAAGGCSLALAQSNQQDQRRNDNSGQRQAAPMMQACRQMMANRRESMSEFAAMDSKLDGLVSTMRQSNGMNRTNAMSNVIQELVSQRRIIRTKTEAMDMSMMNHMMMHMQDGMMKDGMMKGWTMQDCPMMRMMNGRGGG